MKKKIEELKGKAQSLRAQKMELNNKLMVWQSTADSFKEERRSMEAELEEKKNEIKMLKEKEMNSSQEISQVSALTELLKQKETEIEEFKHRFENSINVWSVSADDPSKPQKNLAVTEKFLNATKDGEPLRTREGGTTDQNAIQGEGQLKRFEINRYGKGLIEGSEDIDKNGEEGQSRGRDSLKLQNSQNDEGLRMREEVGNRNETKLVENSKDDNVLKRKDEDEISNGSENAESGEDSDRMQRKNKRWRIINRNRESEKPGNFDGLKEVQKNGTQQERKSTGIGMDDQGFEGKEDRVVSENSLGDNEGFRVRSENAEKMEIYERNQEEISKEGHQLQNPKDGEDLGDKVTTEESNQKVEKEGEVVSEDGESGKAIDSQNVENVSENSSEVAMDNVEQKQNLIVRQPEDQDSNGTRKSIYRREFPGTHSMGLKRKKIPKVTKVQKTWKSTVSENHPEY